jgi:SWI/SNF-related matrix-associated actin-dependent regulator 1 of chromatin subfamily A
MLMGTVMIRRMKNDILKTLPAKVREQGIVDVMDANTRKEMQECMVTLRTGKGRLGQLAQEHADFQELTEPQEATDKSNEPLDQAPNGSQLMQAQSENAAAQLAVATEQLQQEIHHRRAEEQAKIRETLAASRYQLDPAATYSFVRQMEDRLEHDLNAYYQERLQIITAKAAAGTAAVGPGNSLRSPEEASQPEPPSAKKAILNYMYSLTGNVKVPFVVEMLKRWLNDPTRGKLCLFAHHLAVLNAIEEGAGLSNAGDSLTKFIRIDGSTSPQARQEQINAFQGDPSIRIALLGITAAGVAVTLTACSTIWFAEIFWTPAIMIQAEDRCHRIGQQAQVHCLYFVAKGTLDELLWKLLENKFQDLGEFVEGKEKLKMVVNKSYHSKHELLKSIETPDLTDFGDEGDTFSEADLSDIAEIGSDIEHEIEELGVSELGMLDAGGDNDDSEPDSQQNLDAKPAGKEDITGKSENEAICLSDDDDEEEAVSQAAPQAEIPFARVPDVPNSQAVSNPSMVFDKQYPQLKVYKLRFPGQSYGITFNCVAGRLVVVGRSEDRSRTLGLRAKPHVGDVLAAVNGIHIPVVSSMELVTRTMIAAKRKGEVELCFGEDIFITAHVIKLIAAEGAKRAVVLPPKEQSPVNVETNDNDSQSTGNKPE